MKRAIQLCFLMVLLLCSSIYAQPSTSDLGTNSALLAIECSAVAPGGTMNQKSLELTVETLALMAIQGTFFGTSTSNTTGEGAVHGVYYCRGDNLVNATECQACVLSAAEHLATCTVGNSAIAWYEDCTVRVANFEISEKLQLEPFTVVPVQSLQTNPDVATPDPSLEETRINDLVVTTVTEAAAEPTLHFAGNFFTVGQDFIYVVLAQCSPDLSSTDCETCLARAVEIADSPDRCPECPGGPPNFVLLPSCQLILGFV